MRSSNPVYSLPQKEFSLDINGDHNHINRYKPYSCMETGLNTWESFFFGAMPSPNIQNLAKARQYLPFPVSWIGVFEGSLYGMIIHVALTLLGHVI